MTDILQEIANGLETLRPKAEAEAIKRTRSAILEATPSEIMTFVTENGTRYQPAATSTYINALWAFLRSQQLNGHDLDCAVTPRVSEATQSALNAVLSSKEAVDAMVAAFKADEALKNVSRDILNAELQWLAKEMATLGGINPIANATAEITGSAAEQAVAFMKSSAGASVIGAVTKLISTTSGKVLVYKLISASAAKVVASTALKAMTVAIVKKMGIALLTKAVLVKILAVAFPALLAVKIPVLWVILPIVVAYIAYEMKHLPDKLADKLPDQIANKLGKSWPDISMQMATHVLAGAAKRAATGDLEALSEEPGN